MLTKRVIPCLDVKDGRVVKGVNFVGLRDAGDPIELARAYDEQKADEVIFLDITATSDDRATTVELASHASAELHLPYCVGGGFRSVADIRKMIAAGADKVSVNSAAVANPQLITDAARAFGTQAILCAIDAKAVPGNPNKWEVYVAGGRKNTHIDAIEWAREAARRGAGEILLTSMAVSYTHLITRAHFARTGTQVEIVYLHGNIELAPITGMAERIVDITATGTTLRENNLEIVEEVLASTARFFANGCALRTDERIVALARVLAENAPKHTYAPIAGASNPVQPSLS